MLCRLRLFCRGALSILLLLLVFTGSMIAQTFSGEKVPYASLSLQKKFTSWEVFNIDAAPIHEAAKSAMTNPSPITLNLDGHHWTMYLSPSRVTASNYKVQALTSDGVQVIYNNEQKAFQGYDMQGGGTVRLTLDDDFIYGFIKKGNETWYIEPLSPLDPTAPPGLYIVYPQSGVIKTDENKCAVMIGEQEMQNLEEQYDDEGEDLTADAAACYEIDLAIASDYLMFDKYGSVTAVENHNIGVINNVQDNYIGVFIHDLYFVIVTQFVVTTQGGDPWTSSTNAGTLLDDFTNWGNAGNFGVTFDVGELWTDRDFNGGTIGIAWLNGVCNNVKYHCLQDFSTNAEWLRCMTAHEIGHNFSCNHDASGCPTWIMCPTVSSANQWSTISINAVNSYLPSKINGNCLTACGPPPPPLVADFDWTPNPACEDSPVQFSDLSTGNITSYAWMFPGGTPATSTQQNPAVTWANPGTYNVKLTLQGTGGPVSVTKSVEIKAKPVASFTYTVSGTTVTFNSTSTNATGWEWDFGDGNVSYDEDPVHTYDFGGNYYVTLTVSNECGTSTKNIFVNTAPTADFSGSPTTGCAPLTVQFTNESSSNAITFNWQFPGGTPSTSNQQNPVVIYTLSGTHSVTLTATNAVGSNTVTKTGYITVQSIPAASFTKAINGLTVTFTNTSNGASSYQWSFGDGNTSSETNPTHTYDTGGNYTVTLTATNDCGSTSATQMISVFAPPVASFTASPTSGCGPLTVQFTNTSSGNPNTFNWQFPGGNPSSSTDANPVVVYANNGSYSVTLTVSNVGGTNTATQTNFINVNQAPTMSTPNSQSACGGSPVSVAFNGTSGATYAWANSNTAIGLGASGSGNLNFTAANVNAAQTATITVTPSLSGCNGAPVQFTITVNPTPSVSNPGDESACGGSLVNIPFSGTSGASYAWTNSNTNIGLAGSGNGNINFTSANVTTPQTGTITVTPSLASCTGSPASFDVTVNPSPSVSDPADQSACGGASVNVNFAGTAGSNFAWTNSNTNIGLAATGNGNIAFTAANISSPQTGTITVTPSLDGCAGASQNFTVTVNPTPNVSDPANQVVCSGEAVSVNFNSTPAGADFSWTNSNNAIGLGASGTGNIGFVAANVSSSQTGTISVSTSLNGCNGNSENFTITVDPAAVAGFTSDANGLTVDFTNASTNATTYSWNFGDNGSSNEANPSHTYATDGTYTVVLTATGPCGTATATQTVTVLTPPTAAFTASPTSGCGPLTVQFSDASTANATSFNWQFPGGTPSSSMEENPTVVYSVPGAYSVTLTVSNAAGSNSTTQTNYVVVNAGPTANFGSTVNGATASFDNQSDNATTYNWDFGDGNSSNEAEPSHTYTTDNTYTVTLTATNACGTSTATQQVVIITSPNAGFTATTTSGCGPLTVQFTDLSSGNTTAWSWTFEGGNPATSSEQNPLVVFDNPGSYDVTLVASSAGGTSTYNQPNFITVLPDPTAGFTSSVDGTSAAFTNTSTNATSYVWNFGDNSTSNESSPSHTYATDGVYTVVLTATNNCGSSTTTSTVTIVTAPSAGFNPSATVGCAPFNVQFTNTSSNNATTFSWTFEGGTPATSSDQNPSASWSQAGTYNVTLIAGNSAGNDTIVKTVTVNAAPAAGFTIQTAGFGVVLSNTSTGANSYLWDFGDGSTSNEANPSHDYPGPGSYTITLKATNACGTTEFSQTIEIVGSAPLAAFTSNWGEGCAPLTVQFTDQSAGDPTAWQWTFEGGSPSMSNQQNPSVTFPAPGTFTVTLTASNAFGSNSTSSEIVVNSLPVAGFVFQTVSGTVIFGNQSINALSYSWNFGDGSFSNEQSPTHTYAASGTYTVELTAINVCGASTLQQTIQVIVSGVNDPSWLESFRLFPNPNDGLFTIDMSGQPQDEVAFTLFNAIGEMVWRDKASFGTGHLSYKFDQGNLPAGVYSLGVQHGDRTFFVKVVVQQ